MNDKFGMTNIFPESSVSPAEVVIRQDHVLDPQSHRGARRVGGQVDTWGVLSGVV